MTTNHIAIDFESTFFSKRKISLRSMGVDQYLHHPDVCVYLVSVHTDSESYCGHPNDLNWSVLDGREWISHNAAFDRRVWRRLTELQPELRHIRPKSWNCTANMAAWMGVPRSLAGACASLLGVDVDKDARKAMDNRTIEELRNSQHWPEIIAYAKRDAEMCWRLWAEFSEKWPAIEKRISLMTIAQVMRGLPVNSTYIDESIKVLERACWESKKLLPWVSDSSKRAPLSPLAIAEQCRKIGIVPPSSLAEDSVECQRWELEHPDIPWITAMRRFRKTNLLLRKLNAMRDRLRPDGRLDFSHKYCGSHTRRTSGDQGFNVQGFQRDALEGVNMRHAIAAREHHRLIIADLAQIEPRVLAWLTNDVTKLELIRQGVSVYQAHAIQTLGWHGQDLKSEDAKLYALCKMRVLGLSYGCGFAKFVDYCRAQFQYHMTLRESKLQVNSFRRKEQRIVSFWNNLQTALDRSIGQDLCIELPSWNSLVYKDVHLVNRETAATLATGRVNRLWGSLCVENIVQATARDCFYEKLLMIEDAGIPTLFAVHDECITDEIHESQCEEAQECVQEIMAAPCEWLPGLTLGSETKSSQHYLK